MFLKILPVKISLFFLVLLSLIITGCIKNLLIKSPEIRIFEIKISEITFTEVTLQVKVKIKNNSLFDVNLLDLKYQITIGGVLSENAQIDENTMVESKKEQEIVLMVRLPALQSFFLLFKKELLYVVKGEAQIETLFGKDIIKFNVEGSHKF